MTTPDNPERVGHGKTHRWRSGILAATMAMLAFASGGRGQEPAGETASAPAKGGSATPAPEADRPASQGGGESVTSTLPELGDSKLVVPWRELKGLVDRIHDLERLEATRKAKPKPPRAALLESASWSGTVERNATRLAGQLEIELLGDGWQELPLLREGPTIVSASVDGKAARLILAEGEYRLILSGIGHRVVRVELVLPSGTEVGDGSLELGLAPFARNSLVLSIPRTKISVRVDPSGRTTLSERGGRTVVTADYPPTGKLQVFWSGALPEKPARRLPLLARADLSELVSIGSGMVRIEALVDIAILEGAMERVDFRLPAGVNVREVTGEAVRDHRFAREEEGGSMSVFLLRPATGEVSLRIVGERILTGNESLLDVPAIRVLGMERESGTLAVNATTNLEIRPAKSAELAPIDLRELPATLWQAAQHPVLLAWKWSGRPWQLSLDVRRHADIPLLSSTVDSAWLTTIQTADGKRLHSALFQMKNTQKQFLTISLPAGSELLAAFVSDQPVRPASDEQKRVLVPLEKSAIGESDQKPFPVEIVYLESSPPFGLFGRASASAPKIDVPIGVFRWSLHLPERSAYWAFRGDLAPGVGWSPTPRSSDPLEKRAIERLHAEAGGAARGGGVEIGALPVRITLPASGRRFAFQRELLMPKEGAPEVTFRYVDRRLTSALRSLLALASAALTLALALLLRSRRKGVDVSARLRTLVPATLAVLGAIALDGWLFGPFVPSLVAGLLSAVVLTDLLLPEKSAPVAEPGGTTEIC
jgi:hypothetical protein